MVNPTPQPQHDVAIVGGGLAGLTAAAFAARAGASVVVLDARGTLGGRARTEVIDGFHFNEGPRALYNAGAGMDALAALGIRPDGANPPTVQSAFSLGRTVHRLPPWRATRQLVAMLLGLKADRSDPGWADASTEEWIAHRLQDPVARMFAAAMVRVSTYSGALDTFSADGAIHQLSVARHGITYLHGGWAQLVHSLTAAATGAGAVVVTGAKVNGAVAEDGGWTMALQDGSTRRATSLISAAGGPTAADRLTDGASAALGLAAERAIPVHAACLDLGLDRLPLPNRRFVVGIDQPTYLSVHTHRARLSDHDGQVMHVMAYEPAPDTDVSDLERITDEAQPGWRSHERARQVGRQRVVAFDRPQPGRGLAGRPPVTVPDATGLFVAGDWVGSQELLGAAALASGRVAGEAAALHAVSSRRAASSRSER